MRLTNSHKRFEDIVLLLNGKRKVDPVKISAVQG
jgi:hypothetical protein